MDHIPVLLEEIIKILNIKENGIYMDCTLGSGGYTKRILSEKKCHLYALDCDNTVTKYALNIKQNYPDNFTYKIDNFSNLDTAFPEIQGKLDGIVMDLGISSMQIDQPHRGFSFMRDGDLSMSMSNNNIIDAKTVVNTFYEKKISDIIRDYGEEPKHKQIAAQIVKERKKELITTTLQLANIVRSVFTNNTHNKIDNATKTFQAIRIFVNQELENLKIGITKALEMLNTNGILAIVSFHGLEDKIVKNIFKQKSPKTKINKYSKNNVIQNEFQILTKNVIRPTELEINKNIRSRSAKMRAIQKI